MSAHRRYFSHFAFPARSAAFRRGSLASVVVAVLVVVLAAGTSWAEEKKAKSNLKAAVTSKKISKLATSAEGNNDNDPDLPSFVKGIDKAAYLEARAEYIRQLRGVDTALPGSRENAI